MKKRLKGGSGQGRKKTDIDTGGRKADGNICKGIGTTWDIETGA